MYRGNPERLHFSLEQLNLVSLIRTGKAAAAVLLEATGAGAASFPSVPPATTNLLVPVGLTSLKCGFVPSRTGSVAALAVSAKQAMEET